MSEVTPEEGRRIVREKLSQDWTREIDADEYLIAPGGWKWRGAYVYADGPAEPDPDSLEIALGLAAVDIRTGAARRLATAETFAVLDEGEELPGTPQVDDPED